jgi:hypothetical protein
MRSKMLAVLTVAALGGTGSLFGLGGTIQDQAVSFTLPVIHWGTTAAADLRGAWPDPGVDPLAAAGYWYRVEGVDTREHRFPAPDSENYYADGSLVAVWNDVHGKGFRATLVVGVFDYEHPAGGFTSELMLAHLGGPARTVRIFHYLDADVPGLASDDRVTSPTPSFLRFTDLGGSVLRYRARDPDSFQVGAYPTLRDALNDADADDLSSSGAPFGPGNATAAYRWSVNLGPTSLIRLTGGVSFTARQPADYVKGERSGRMTGFPSLYFQRLSPAEELLTWEMRRTAHYGSSLRSLEPGRVVVAADDFDGDFTTDLVEFHAASGQTYVDGDPVTGALPSPPGWRIEASGDFDRDGRPDLVWRSALTRKVVIWRMDGAHKLGDIVPVPDQATDANWEIAAAVDLNGDGLRDLLWYNSISGRIVIWAMNATVERTSGYFTTPMSAGDNNWRVVAAGDFGKGPAVSGTPVHGTNDIVWRNATSGRLVVWHMDLSGVRTGGVFTTPDSPSDPLNLRVVGPR